MLGGRYACALKWRKIHTLRPAYAAYNLYCGQYMRFAAIVLRRIYPAAQVKKVEGERIFVRAHLLQK